MPIAGVLRFAFGLKATEIVLPKKAAEIAEKRKRLRIISENPMTFIGFWSRPFRLKDNQTSFADFHEGLRFYGKQEHKRERNMKRSMYAGRVREEHIGQITLKGWVARRRDVYAVFIDLRDREGIMQLVSA